MAEITDDDINDFYFTDEEIGDEEDLALMPDDPLEEPASFDSGPPSGEAFDFSGGPDGLDDDIDLDDSRSMPRWALFAGGGVLGVALLAAAASFLLGGQDANTVVVGENTTQAVPEGVPVTPGGPTPDATEPATAATGAPSDTPAPADSTVDVEAESLLASVDFALERWGDFAATGELRRLEGAFDPDGPQFAQLSSEVETITPVPLGTYTFERTGAPRPQIDGDAASILTAIDYTRVDGDAAITESFQWRIDMTRVDGLWVLNTVTTVVPDQT